MKCIDFLMDSKWSLLLNGVGITFLAGYLVLVNVNSADIFLIIFCWVMTLIFYYTGIYFKKRQYLMKLQLQFNELDEKRFISEMMEKPYNYELDIMYTIIKESGQSMHDEIARLESLQKDYREYIEQWVHEIKLPISVVKMISENNRNELTKTICEEVDKIEMYVEQTLYYARSETVEKDYFIKSFDLYGVLSTVLKKHKQQFITNKIGLEIIKNEISVLSDEKWIAFILSQLLDNAVKYADTNHPKVKIELGGFEENPFIKISNNGDGILPQDIGRIFDKGFTGTTGRHYQKSTGMGLYLVKKMCEKLNHHIDVQSKKHLTTVTLTFYTNQLF